MRTLHAYRPVSEKPGTGLRVVAAGLPRCATTSLQAAFEKLGYSPCLHMADIAPYASKLRTFKEASLEKDKTKRQAMIKPIFDRYVACADYPSMMFIDDLMDMYPDCVFILNKRASPEAWLRSFKDTIDWFTRSDSSYRWIALLVATDREHWHLHQASKQVYRERYGTEVMADIRTYNAHFEWVHRCAEERGRGRDLLAWEPADGWEPICELLEKPVPNEPFPRLNDTATIKLLTKVVIVRGFLYWGALLSFPFLGYHAIRRVMGWWQS